MRAEPRHHLNSPAFAVVLCFLIACKASTTETSKPALPGTPSASELETKADPSEALGKKYLKNKEKLTKVCLYEKNSKLETCTERYHIPIGFSCKVFGDVAAKSCPNPQKIISGCLIKAKDEDKVAMIRWNYSKDARECNKDSTVIDPPFENNNNENKDDDKF